MRRLVEQHGGTVAAASEGAGQGQHASPCACPPSRGRRTRAPTTAPATRPAAARRVLVIEDNDDSRQMLRELIRRLGHEVYEAADGVTGRELPR